MLYFFAIALFSAYSSYFSYSPNETEIDFFSECLEISDEIRAKIPKNFANYILEESGCLPSETHSDIFSYIFFLNENAEKIAKFSDINTKTRAIIVQNPYFWNEFLESDFCDGQKCPFSLKNQKIMTEKFCKTDTTIFGNAVKNWGERLIDEKNMTIDLSRKTGKIPIFYGTRTMKWCD